MTYTVTILRRAQRELASTPAIMLPHIRDAIRALGMILGLPVTENWPGVKAGVSVSAITA